MSLPHKGHKGSAPLPHVLGDRNNRAGRPASPAHVTAVANGDNVRQRRRASFLAPPPPQLRATDLVGDELVGLSASNLRAARATLQPLARPRAMRRH